MAENYSICPVGVMDRLWFHHIILLPEPHSPPSSQTPKSTSLLTSESSPHPSGNDCQPPLIPEEVSSTATAFPPQQDVCKNNNNQESGTRTPPPLERERPTRLNLLASKTRSHSSSPSVQKRHPIHLKKTRSCKTLRELEVEEVKGFMDLGFTFNKQHLTKRITRLIPGLRRLEEEEQEEDYNDKEEKQRLLHSNEDDEAKKEGKDDDDDDDDEEEGCAGIMRPYLSEAWLINRPDSPLLNLRVPRASAAADMKKHLKYWARTVATVIHQES